MASSIITYPPDVEAFRLEVRAWLEQNLPKGGFNEDFELSPAERKKFNEGWPAKLFAGGWICATWPKEYGGKGLSTLQGVVLNEEFARAR
ncbi:MAG: acyl-CoA dehydrogenase family protein, partial [Actinomycetota bacterium]